MHLTYDEIKEFNRLKSQVQATEQIVAERVASRQEKREIPILEDVLDLLAYIKGSDHGNICFFRVYRRGKDGTAMLVVVYRGSLYSTQVREFNCDESEVLEILTENGYEFLEFCWL